MAKSQTSTPISKGELDGGLVKRCYEYPNSDTERVLLCHLVYPLQPAREDGGCVICQHPYDSPENQIVLCDNCDRGFHQLCYSPAIENKYVEIPDLEWNCYLCDQPLSATSTHGLSELTEDMSLTGGQLSQGVKDSYLRSLSKSNLLKLISRIESSSPTVKLYPSRLSSPTSVHAVVATPSISESLLPRGTKRTDQEMMSSSTQADYFGAFD